MTASFLALAGPLAGLISAVAFLPYFLSIFRGHAKPNVASWLIWTVVGVALCTSHWATGARHSVWVPLSYVIGPFVLTLLAFRYGDRVWTRFDKACLGAAALSFFLWWLSGNPLVALCMNVTIDFLGALPTIRKSWSHPESEDRLSWTMFLVANTVNLLAVESWRFSGAMYPLYLVLVTLIITVLLWRPRGKQTSNASA